MLSGVLDSSITGTATINCKVERQESFDEVIADAKTGETVNVTGGSEVDAQTVEPGNTATEPDDPTKVGYRFLGWYLGDVPDGYWAEDEIYWVYYEEYMNGTTATTFDPAGNVTRQQLVTLLYRYAVLMGYDVSVARIPIFSAIPISPT